MASRILEYALKYEPIDGRRNWKRGGSFDAAMYIPSNQVVKIKKEWVTYHLVVHPISLTNVWIVIGFASLAR